MAQPNWSYLDGLSPEVRGGGMLGRMGAKLPNAGRVLRGVGALGTGAAKALPVAGAALAVGGEAMGVMEKVNDPNATGLDVATRAAEGVGRLSSMGAGAGLGATAGSVFGPVGTAAGGVIGGTVGYFAPDAIYAARDWWAGRGAAPKAAPGVTAPVAPAAPAAPFAPAPNTGASMLRAAENDMTGAGTTPANALWTTATAENIRGSGVPAEGTGGFINNRTGAVTTLDSRGTPGFGAVQDTTSPVADGSVGSYVGAVMNQRRAASVEASTLAQQKLAVEGMGKGATAAKAYADADQAVFQTAAARAHLAKNPGDYAGAAAAASGRAIPRDSYSVPFPPMNDKDPVTVLNKGTGALERRQPTQPISLAQAVASAKKNGTYKSDAQVRADLARMPGYRLTD